MLWTLQKTKEQDMLDTKKDTPKSATNQKYHIIENRLLSILTDKPASKSYLISMVGENERTIRKCIHNLRKQGHPICSSASSRGYWLGTKADVTATANEMRSRAYELLRTANTMDRMDPNQMRIEEVQSEC